MKKVQDMRSKEVIEMPTATELSKEKKNIPKLDTEFLKKYRKVDTDEDTFDPSLLNSRPQRKKSKFRSIVWFIVFSGILASLLSASFVFAKAVVTITPKTREIVLDKTPFIASKDDKSAALGFNVMVVSGEESLDVSGVAGQSVTTSAKGSVRLYNKSTSNQIFVAETRLVATNGKIYKLDSKVTIPSGKTLDVTVHAEKAGTDYNMSLTDFTVLGLKGTANYKLIYGESLTPMTGGFSGQGYAIAPDVLADAIKKTDSLLKDKLIKQVHAQVPSDFILYPDAVIYTPVDSASLVYDTATIHFTRSASLSAFVFDRKKLQMTVANTVLSARDPQNFAVHGVDSLLMVFNQNNFTPTSSQISFTLSGSARIVWEVSKNGIPELLISKKKSELENLLSQYPTIDSAEVSMTPFWRNSFPKEAKDIFIKVLSQ